MKKYFYIITAFLSLSLTGCYNDDDVWEALDGQEQRIAALEAWQETANQNIAALQAIANGNDYITAVTPVKENGETIGYTISFLHQGDITIYHGKDGEKGDKGDKGDTGAAGSQGEKGETGDTPLIGIVKQSDGKWYWTLNGELLKDADGNTICASGKDGQDGSNGSNGSSGTSAPTPQLKYGWELGGPGGIGGPYESYAVYLSVDGGKTWTKVSGSNGDSFFKEAPVEGAYSWTFTLADGTPIVVPKYTNLALYYSIDNGNNKQLIENAKLSVGIGESFSIICEPAKGCKWSYKKLKDENGNEVDWDIRETDEGLSFPSTDAEKTVTILFTLTTQDNQVFFYQVTVTAKDSNVIIKKEIRPELATALANIGFKANANGDIVITAEEIESRTSLNLSNASLTSLEGLECFANLESLDCSNNKLNDIDVSVFPKLTYLECSNNELTTLDLSALPNLKILRCENCLSQPEVASRSLVDGVLDLSGNPELEVLYCPNNGLTKLILSNNKNLIDLTCYDNQLSELNVTANTALRSLICGGNPLTELIVTNNTELQTLWCGDNQLSELNVTANTALSNLICSNNQLTELNVTNNTELHTLWCYDNQLSELNIAANTALQKLLCSNNQLTELIVTANTELQTLWCDDNQLSKLNLTANTALQDLLCDNNQLNELNITANTELQTLWCSNNQLSELNIAANTALQKLTCNNNQLTELDVTANTELQLLWCNDNQLTELNVTANKELQDLGCGRQKTSNGNDIVLVLTIDEAQQEKWDTSWKDNENVVLSEHLE